MFKQQTLERPSAASYILLLTILLFLKVGVSLLFYFFFSIF